MQPTFPFKCDMLAIALEFWYDMTAFWIPFFVLYVKIDRQLQIIPVLCFRNWMFNTIIYQAITPTSSSFLH